MAHAWDFGWDALVAIFTGALACATYWLARVSARQIAAQDRPILVPVEGNADSNTPLNVAPNRVQAKVTNAGGGPALDVLATLNGLEANPWHSAVIAPGASAVLTFARRDGDETDMTLDLAYDDMAGATHRSTITIRRLVDLRAGTATFEMRSSKIMVAMGPITRRERLAVAMRGPRTRRIGHRSKTDRA